MVNRTVQQQVHHRDCTVPFEPWFMRDTLPSEILSRGVMPPLPAVVGPLLWVRESGTSTVTGFAVNMDITR